MEYEYRITTAPLDNKLHGAHSGGLISAWGGKSAGAKNEAVGSN